MPGNDQTVIIRFKNSLDALAELAELETRLQSVMEQSGQGYFDGCDVPCDMLQGQLYLHGPDAETIFQLIKPVLESFSFLHGATVRLRFGPPRTGTQQRQVKLLVKPQPELNAEPELLCPEPPPSIFFRNGQPYGQEPGHGE